MAVQNEMFTWGLIWVYVEGLLRLRKFADQFVPAYIGFT